MSKPNMNDYVDVAERIRVFYVAHPKGSLKSGSEPRVIEINGKAFIAYHAQAFRHPDDPCPTDGWAWEPVPGPTNFTKDSELMNAETSAWGRAIAALGFETKKIASANEVRNRSGAGSSDTSTTGRENPDRSGTIAPEAGSTPAPETNGGMASPAKFAYITALVSDLAKKRSTTQKAVREALANDGYDFAELSEEQADELIAKLERWKKNLAGASA
jgi:hypothetical protein